jgi:hypothetical protein
MGYFDALTSSAFKTTADGRTLFYPFGVLGRGYEVVSETDRARLRWQTKAWVIFGLVIALAAVNLEFRAGLIVIAAWMVAYLVWTFYALRGTRQSDVKFPLLERIEAQARVIGPVTLWMLEIGALVFVAGGFLMLIVDPGRWLVAAAGIVFFGAGAVKFGYMLVLRGRT